MSSGGGGGGRGGDDGVEVVDQDKADNGSQGDDPPQDPLPPAVNLDQVVARTEFHETAFFYPHLRSDSEGEVSIEFTLPEDLTEWRFMGFAHDTALRSGFLTDTMVTAKDLMVQVNAPRFVREGDVIEFPVKVTNQSAARQTGQVRLTFSNLRTEASMDSTLGNLTTEQAFDVPSHESRTYTWRITIPDGCETLAYRAVGATTRLSDGEEKYLPVLSRRQLVIESLPLPIRGAQTKEFEFGSLLASDQSDTLRHQSLTVQMVSQPAWYAVMALPYLMEHPHRSTDQIFNRYYANSLASYIANSDSRIRTVFDQWKNTEALDSPLDKNEDLKAVLLEETPWVRQANSESQARRNVGILFDQNRLTQELSSTLAQLKTRQYASGLWPWYPWGSGNEYVTLRIVCGFGRLRHLGVDLDVSLAIKALNAVDSWVYNYLTRDEDHRVHSRPSLVLYLYARSFFLEDAPINPALWAVLQPELAHLRAHWLDLPRQSQAQLALALKRLGDLDTPHAIMASIREHSVQDEELGMFWRDLERSWSWYHAPIETQAMMIEAFDEVAGDADAVQACQVWLLKQKQTQHWKTTQATVDSIYALLLRGNSLLASNEIVEVALADEWIVPENIEAGTGFYETRFSGSEVEPDMGHVTVKKQDEGVSWGSVHWQYLEDVAKITAYEDTPLQLTKALYIKKSTETGPVLFPADGPLAVGDELVVRLELRVDRDMEYVHLKDQRGSGTEPVVALSRYRYQDGLGYYESVRDTATHFFMAYLPKGVYVFEYSTRVQHRGQYQSGIASIQCLYAPEFNSHSQSFELDVQ
ncbi:MAG: alpha-2-macroglobulin family protein [Phycisphaeraceae bacterium]|nr:alpha-2-macroglobulin family protein [Phycisphaeraceae bacterium]